MNEEAAHHLEPWQVGNAWLADYLGNDRDARSACLAAGLVGRIVAGQLPARRMTREVLSTFTIGGGGLAWPTREEVYWLIHRDTIRQYADELEAAWASQVGPMSKRLMQWARLDDASASKTVQADETDEWVSPEAAWAWLSPQLNSYRDADLAVGDDFVRNCHRLKWVEPARRQVDNKLNLPKLLDAAQRHYDGELQRLGRRERRAGSPRGRSTGVRSALKKVG